MTAKELKDAGASIGSTGLTDDGDEMYLANMDVAESLPAQPSNCPICGIAIPHTHAGEEVAVSVAPLPPVEGKEKLPHVFQPDMKYDCMVCDEPLNALIHIPPEESRGNKALRPCTEGGQCAGVSASFACRSYLEIAFAEPKPTLSNPAPGEGVRQLQEAFRQAQDEVASWPAWKREAGMALMFPDRLTPAKFEPRDPTPSAPAVKLSFCPWERCKTDGECRFPAECSANDSYIEHLENQLKLSPDSSSIPVGPNICVCGKAIWGEGWEPSTGQRFFSHVEGGEEMHADGSWVRPTRYSDWFKTPKASVDRVRGSSSISPELAWLEAHWKSALVEGKDDYACALQVAIEALKASEPKKEMEGRDG